MKNLLILIFSLVWFGTSYGQDTNNANYPVQHATNSGFAIVATNNFVAINTPKGATVNLSDPFISTDANWAPTGLIDCIWSPDGSYVAIFVPHPRVTDIFVYSLKVGKSLNQVFPDIKFPAWYDAVYSTSDLPGEWSGNTLSVATTVKLRNGNDSRVLPQTITINGDNSTSNISSHINNHTLHLIRE